jgi:hypothetical protein
MSRNNPIPNIVTYFFNILSNIVLSSMARPSKGLFPVGVRVKTFESTPTFFHFGYMTCPFQSYKLNQPDFNIDNTDNIYNN